MAISLPTLRSPCGAMIPNSAKCARKAFTSPVTSSACVTPSALDVLVQAEEVGRIILVLQGDQLRILRRTIGGLHPLYSLVRLLPQIVDVHPIGRERLHRLPELARPPDARRGLRRIRARPGADEVIANVAVVKRGLFLTHAAYRAPPQFVNRDVAPHQRRAQGRRSATERRP